MLEISNVRLPLDAGLPHADAARAKAAAAAIGVPARRIDHVEVLKLSVDARKKSDVHFVAALAVAFASNAAEKQVEQGQTCRARGVNVKRHVPYQPLEIPQIGSLPVRPVVVGTGPAGLFAALYLARAGARPLVVERGADVDARTKAVESFDAGGPLNLQTNVQFGEGGAGTFSDGKLYTGTKSPLARHVLQWFVDAGAPQQILWEAKPHIGTDKLVDVVRSMREEIVRLGGDVRFLTKLTTVKMKNDHIQAVNLQDERTGKDVWEPADALILACGHSARDTFQMMRDAGFLMERKPFSMGVRIEHRQDDINRAQYGKAAGHPALGAADYKLVAHLPNGRSVYTFCMCPGGQVVCAASEDGGVVVNGMSRFARDGDNANAALLVDVRPDDFAGEDVLAGMKLQRQVEQAAFETACAAGGAPYQAPAQTVADFLAGSAGAPSAKVVPSYARGVVWCDLHTCLPDFVADSLEAGIPALDRKLHGFADSQAVMTGVETRSSSPVRIVRGSDGQAILSASMPHEDIQDAKKAPGGTGIFPAGEGPGYAGGIMSAAVDGIRAAQNLVFEYRRKR